MKMIKKFIVLSLLSAPLFSCSEATMRNIWHNYLPEKAIGTFKEQLKDASPEFRNGWADGCEVGMASGSANVFYQMFYKNNRVDGYAKANSADYRTAWGSAFWYCARYEEIKQGSSIWGSYFGGYK